MHLIVIVLTRLYNRCDKNIKLRLAINMKSFKPVISKLCLFLAFGINVFYVGVVNAAFPNDLDDVVFIEDNGGNPGLTQFMRDMAVTGTLEVSIGGRDAFGGEMVVLDNSQRNAWPNNIFDCCNANAWLVVRVDGIWYAGTWEFMRVGQTVKSTLALVGPRHLRFPPLQNFRPQNGEIYGFFNSCIVRNGIGPSDNNCRERTEIALYRFGEGPVGFDAIGGDVGDEDDTPQTLVPILRLLDED